MNFLRLWMLLLALALCSGEEIGGVVNGNTPPNKQWVTLKLFKGIFLCSTSSSLYYSKYLNDECRWQVISRWQGYLLKNSYGKYLSGNQEGKPVRLGGSSTIWAIARSQNYRWNFKWEIENTHYHRRLGWFSNKFSIVSPNTELKNLLWMMNYYEEERSAMVKNSYRLKTCLKGDTGEYLSISSDGNRMGSSSVCGESEQWILKRISDYYYTIQNSKSKKYLVYGRGGYCKLNPSSYNGKWYFYSNKKGYLIKTGNQFFLRMGGSSPSTTEARREKECTWTLETPKIEKKKPLQQRKFNIALYYVPEKKYLTSFGNNYYFYEKNIDSLWVAVPEGIKASKHYLVNFEGMYLTATSTSATLSPRKTNEGLWKIEEIDKKYWRLTNIRTGKYLDMYNSKFRLSSQPKPKWVVSEFKYSEDLMGKFSNSLSFYNSRYMEYISLKLDNPQMKDEASPLKIKKDGLFYYIEYKGKYLNLNSGSEVPHLSKTRDSDSLYKIYKKSNGFYEFVPYRHQGAKLGVLSSGHLKAIQSNGMDIQWKLSTYKKPLPKPVKTLPEAFKGKIASLRTPGGKYLGADKNGKKIILTTVLKDSYWNVAQKEEGIFYLISPYKTYLSLGSKGLYQSKIPKDGSKWKIIIKGTKWAIKSAINHKFISVKNEKAFVLSKNDIYYWNFEEVTVKSSTTTTIVEDPKDYFGTELFIQSESKMLLKYENNKVSASADEDSLWKITDAANGMFYVSTKDNFYLHSAKKGEKAALKKDLSEKAKWKIEIKNDKWIIKSNLYGTYLSLNKKNEIVCAKKKYQWQVGVVTLAIIDSNIFIQDQKSKLFLGEDFGEIKMLPEPTSDAYIMLSRKKANVVSMADSWSNYITESSQKISSTYDLTKGGLWLLQEKKKGAVFKNKVSGRYLYYSSKGKLTTTSNKAKALWTIYLA